MPAYSLVGATMRSTPTDRLGDCIAFGAMREVFMQSCRRQYGRRPHCLAQCVKYPQSLAGANIRLAPRRAGRIVFGAIIRTRFRIIATSHNRADSCCVSTPYEHSNVASFLPIKYFFQEKLGKFNPCAFFAQSSYIFLHLSRNPRLPPLTEGRNRTSRCTLSYI